MVAHTQQSGGGSWEQVHSGLHSKFQVILDNIVRPYLKTKQNKVTGSITFIPTYLLAYGVLNGNKSHYRTCPLTCPRLLWFCLGFMKSKHFVKLALFLNTIQNKQYI
jgi:hypothetical protein